MNVRTPSARALQEAVKRVAKTEKVLREQELDDDGVIEAADAHCEAIIDRNNTFNAHDKQRPREKHHNG